MATAPLLESERPIVRFTRADYFLEESKQCTVTEALKWVAVPPIMFGSQVHFYANSHISGHRDSTLRQLCTVIFYTYCRSSNEKMHALFCWDSHHGNERLIKPVEPVLFTMLHLGTSTNCTESPEQHNLVPRAKNYLCTVFELFELNVSSYALKLSQEKKVVPEVEFNSQAIGNPVGLLQWAALAATPFWRETLAAHAHYSFAAVSCRRTPAISGRHGMCQNDFSPESLLDRSSQSLP